jgi:hypothetical protein
MSDKASAREFEGDADEDARSRRQDGREGWCLLGVALLNWRALGALTIRESDRSSRPAR